MRNARVLVTLVTPGLKYLELISCKFRWIFSQVHSTWVLPMGYYTYYNCLSDMYRLYVQLSSGFTTLRESPTFLKYSVGKPRGQLKEICHCPKYLGVGIMLFSSLGPQELHVVHCTCTTKCTVNPWMRAHWFQAKTQAFFRGRRFFKVYSRFNSCTLMFFSNVSDPLIQGNSFKAEALIQGFTVLPNVYVQTTCTWYQITTHRLYY